MTKKIIILLIAFISIQIKAQEKLGTLTLTPVVFDENSAHEQVSPRVKNLLKNKMRRIASKYGFSSGVVQDRHIMFPDIQVISKNVIPSAPPRVSMEIELTFYIADYDTRTIYTSESFEIIGVGINETKAYYNALRKINANNKKFKAFMERGKQKIIDYYNTHCDLILKQAQTKARIGQEQLALSMLTRIPSDCTVCYNKAMDKSIEIYKSLEDKLCKQNLAKAQSIWTTDPSYRGARRTEPYLSRILPGSTCYNEAKSLLIKMQKHIQAREKRNWEYRLHREKNDYELRKMQLKLSYEVAIENAKNKPTYVYRSWWW